MKNLQKFFAAAVLTLALATHAFAGQISTTVAPPTPEPPPATTQGQISTGVASNIETGGSSEATTNASMTETALNLLQNVLSLF